MTWASSLAVVPEESSPKRSRPAQVAVRRRGCAVATQAWVTPTYGPECLSLLEDGKIDAEVVEYLRSQG